MNVNELLAKADRRLKDVHPLLAEKARELIRQAHSKGIYILITQGLRTIAEQNELYAQGREKPGEIVTNAKGGYSYHNFGLAFDFVIASSDGTAVYWNENVDTNKDGKKDWYQVGQLGKSLGLEWGGDFRSFKDPPHFQLTFGLSLAELRSGKKPPPSGSYTPPEKSYLEQGDRGNKVKELQGKLVKLGYDTGGVDGIYDNATANAVMVLQRRTGLQADGIAGEKTLAKIEELLKELKENNKDTEKEEPNVEYKKDAAASPRFREAQKWVKEKGISDGTYPQRPVTREEVWSMLYRASQMDQ
ncbi:peptidoglycan-binding protein [Bacillus sp. PK3_68]|uniref:peptidoglycan-binding protein n=1 Tax=Bacillus sp. PK3_68 TaxID=2027408 RepID=UPI000E72C38A|nr:peptidoglycan-binding protein [Bacillus sp. PK3_68]RJS59326.1 hypothetical protein CJ483_03945 [Bacillus sp. PK3_68]